MFKLFISSPLISEARDKEKLPIIVSAWGWDKIRLARFNLLLRYKYENFD